MKGSKCKLFKFLDEQWHYREIRPNMTMHGLKIMDNGSERGIHSATKNKYIGYGWMDKDFVLTKKGYEEWLKKRV